MIEKEIAGNRAIPSRHPTTASIDPMNQHHNVCDTRVTDLHKDVDIMEHQDRHRLEEDQNQEGRPDIKRLAQEEREDQEGTLIDHHQQDCFPK